MLDIEQDERYFIKVGSYPYNEVTKADWVTWERRCHFYNTLGKPNEPATGGFSSTTAGSTVEGHVFNPRWNSIADYAWKPDYHEALIEARKRWVTAAAEHWAKMVPDLLDPNYARDRCQDVSMAFLQYLVKLGLVSEKGRRDGEWEVTEEREHDGYMHVYARVDRTTYDFTYRQFDPEAPVPRIIELDPTQRRAD